MTKLPRFGAALILLVLLVCTGMGSRPPIVGGLAPLFTLKDPGNQPISVEQFRGKIVLLTFWATWCEPCKKEMPELQAAYDKHKEKGFVVLAINFGESPNEASAFMTKLGLTFPVLLDPKAHVAAQYGVVSLPVTFFLDRKGFVQDRIFGGTLTETGIQTILQRIAEADVNRYD